MQATIKKFFVALPVFVKAPTLMLVETWYRRKVRVKEKEETSNSFLPESLQKTRKRILIYHKNALSFGGTERCLQIVAKTLSNTYEVFVMHSSDLPTPNRKEAIEKFVTFIPFSHKQQDSGYPYYIHEMSPRLEEVIKTLAVDLLIVSGPGKTEYPYILETTVPILQMNNFGAPNMQENVRKIIFVSEEIRRHSENYTGKREKDVVQPIPVDTDKTGDSVQSLRKMLSIPEDAFIFGRIGRNSDDIYDPIGIKAFKKVVGQHTKAHYVIVSPPPRLKEFVQEEKIPNVHFIEPTTDENIIWSFHYGIDALAHFRYDGETQGLNICEAMHAGKPIISHQSPLWNAHTEYLEKSFARVAGQGQVDEYASYMEEFIRIRTINEKQWENMQKSAKAKAGEFFSLPYYKQFILSIVADII